MPINNLIGSLDVRQELRRTKPFFVVGIERKADRASADEFQRLLHRCYVNQRRMRRATLFGYWFTCLGLAAASVMYLCKLNHWWGVR